MIMLHIDMGINITVKLFFFGGGGGAGGSRSCNLELALNVSRNMTRTKLIIRFFR